MGKASANDETARLLQQALDKDPFIHRVVRLVPKEDPAEGIEEGIPVPAPMRSGRYDQLLNILKVGQSKALPIDEKDSLRDAVKAWKHKYPGVDYVTRQEHETKTVRIWRVK